MKAFIKYTGAFLIASLFLSYVFSGVAVAQSQEDAPPIDQPVSYQSFYDALSPYGQWVNYGHYGYVWIPDAGADFRPYYTDGHWVYTTYGWTWVSDYAWGWAPFHYGRWLFDNSYGWLWVPGDTWGPAWVAWRSSPQYYGWAPLGPGMSLSVSIGAIAADRWAFIPCGYITNPQINRYYISSGRNVTIIRNTTVINNTYVQNKHTYVRGPRTTDVERYTHAPVRTFAVSNVSRPGKATVGNGQIRIFHPPVRNTSSGKSRPAPAKVAALKDVRKPSAPGKTPPRTTAPRTATPVQPQRTQRTHVQKNSRPAQSKPAQQHPVKQRPVQQRPVQSKPAQQHPVRQRPVKQRPAQQRPAQQRQFQQHPAQQPPSKPQQRTVQPLKQKPVMVQRPQPKPQPPQRDANDRNFKPEGH